MLASPALGYAHSFLLLLLHWFHFSLIILRVDVTWMLLGFRFILCCIRYLLDLNSSTDNTGFWCWWYNCLFCINICVCVLLDMFSDFSGLILLLLGCLFHFLYLVYCIDWNVDRLIGRPVVMVFYLTRWCYLWCVFLLFLHHLFCIVITIHPVIWVLFH